MLITLSNFGIEFYQINKKFFFLSKHINKELNLEMYSKLIGGGCHCYMIPNIILFAPMNTIQMIEA